MTPFHNFFGSEIFKRQSEKPLEVFDFEGEPSAEEISSSAAGLLAHNFVNEAVPEDEIKLIEKFREISLSSEIDLALNEIQNEVFIFNVPGKKAIDVDFNQDSKLSDSLKKRISEEFDYIYGLLDFSHKGPDYFMNWYVDGRIFFHKVFDKDDTKKGLRRIIQIDPLKIKKIVEFPDPDQKGLYDLTQVKEFFVYSDTYRGAKGNNKVNQITRSFKVHPDAITFVDSGVYDRTKGKNLGFLYKTVVPFNNLKLLEDSVLIYRVTRAPERRAFYIDVGNLPKGKAEQYVRELMSKFKSKLSYDPKTGTLIDKSNVLSMVEDFWLPRKDGRGTEIETLPGGQLAGELADLEHFKVKFWQSLNIPVNRFTEQAPAFTFGRTTEIYRDEYRFKKFIDKIRNRFALIFEDILKTQLILKKVISYSDWASVKNSIQWTYAEDNSFVEYKESEVLNERLESLQRIEGYVGTFFSKDWVMRNILKLGDDGIETMLKQIEDERQSEKPEQPDESEDEDGDQW